MSNEPGTPYTNEVGGNEDQVRQLSDSHVGRQRPLLSPEAKPRRSQKAFTPHEYKQAIYAHSQRFVVSSSFSGRNYAALANWLFRPIPAAPVRDGVVDREDNHMLVVVHNLVDHSSSRTRVLAEEDTAGLPGPPVSQGTGQLLFVRGFLSPAWVAELGSKYRVDPEFFCRHLDFFDASVHRNCFNTPSLLNTTNNIIHVSISTILTDVLAFSNVSLYDNSVSHRSLIRDQMSRYTKSLQKVAKCGDSIVRDFSILSNRFSVVEQRISICIADHGDGWIGLLCIDSSHDLYSSIVGPWKSDLSQDSNSKVTALPVIQHHYKMTWRKLGGDVGATSRPSNSPSSSAQPGLPQSISTLPLHYPSLLSALDLSKRAQSNPLHALIPVFAHAAFAEVAFLNLVDELVDKLTEPLSLDHFQNETFETLQHFEIILERHATQTRHCIRSIQVLTDKNPITPPHDHTTSHGGRNSRSPPHSLSATDNKGTASPHAHHQQTSSFSSVGILQGYEDLLERCLRLLARVSSAKTSKMNRAMILESRRAIEQSERMEKLTLLATYLIPLTFTASLFGMNFGALGQGKPACVVVFGSCGAADVADACTLFLEHTGCSSRTRKIDKGLRETRTRR